MTMLEKVMNARKDALRSKDKVMPRVLNMVLNTAREKAGVVGSSEAQVSDADICDALRKSMKDNTEMAANHESRGEHDKVEYFNAVNMKLEALLPETLSDEQLKELIESMGTKNIGQIMGKLKAEHSGKYDPRKASEIAKSL